MFTKEVFSNNNFDANILKKTFASYFKNYVGLLVDWNTINFKSVIIDGLEMYIVILKDDIRRINVNSGGSGVLRQKQWSIFVFNNINAKQYENIFGRNKNKKDIFYSTKANSYEIFEYAATSNVYRGEHPDSLNCNKKICALLHNYIYNKLYNNYRFLFLNSYVYTVIDIIDIETKSISFNTFYYNTNHVFRQVPTKMVINQKVDINKTSFLVEKIDNELGLIETYYNDMNDLLEAYRGNLPLNPITSLNFNNIKKDIDSGENFIITEGMARTGKTIIAMRLLGLFAKSKLLIMNEYFYKSICEIFKIERIEFPSSRIACHTQFDNVKNNFLKDTEILIVDEAQRLNFGEINFLMENNSNNKNVFLGDNLQKINCNEDRGLNYLEDKIINRGFDYKKYYFSSSIGIPVNVLYAIKFLVFSNIPNGNQNLNNYEVNFYNNEEDFYRKYCNDVLFKKHMTTIYLNDYRYYKFGIFERRKPNEIKKFNYFLDKDFKESIILTTFEMISRELDNIYIYLPKEVSANENGLHYIDKEKDDYLLNQLYILMTRAKGSVNVLCENSSTYNYFTNRYLMLNKYVQQDLKLLPEQRKIAKELESIINEKGITRLIHFTAEENINSIYQHGLMSIKELKDKGLKYDCNDPIRLDNVDDGISLSVQNPNTYFLKKLKEKYPNKKYVYLILDPALLYEITDDSGEKLANRIYNNYNAASSKTLKSESDINIMFPHTFYGGSWINTRELKEDSEPTAEQAEILFRSTIDPKYILEVIEV